MPTACQHIGRRLPAPLFQVIGSYLTFAEQQAFLIVFDGHTALDHDDCVPDLCKGLNRLYAAAPCKNRHDLILRSLSWGSATQLVSMGLRDSYIDRADPTCNQLLFDAFMHCTRDRKTDCVRWVDPLFYGSTRCYDTFIKHLRWYFTTPESVDHLTWLSKCLRSPTLASWTHDYMNYLKGIGHSAHQTWMIAEVGRMLVTDN